MSFMALNTCTLCRNCDSSLRNGNDIYTTIP